MAGTRARKDAPPDALAEYDATVKALHDAFVVTPRQQDAANLLHVNGKTLRDNTRDQEGKDATLRAGFEVTHVSKGAIWPGALAEFIWQTPYIQRAVVALVGARPVQTLEDAPAE